MYVYMYVCMYMFVIWVRLDKTHVALGSHEQLLLVCIYVCTLVNLLQGCNIAVTSLLQPWH